MKARILPAGESCFFVDFGEKIDREINIRVHSLKNKLEQRPFQGMKELVPTYRSLSVYFDPLSVPLAEVRKRLEEEVASSIGKQPSPDLEIRIPVCYGGEYGPDLENVSRHTGLSPEEVIRRHSGSSLYCYMLGFTPGFPYLGGMDSTIAAPRLTSPRKVIPAGSVGIAGAQTGVYPSASPGGWQLIGRTPLKLYDPARTPAAVIRPGTWVKFQPITAEEFAVIDEQCRIGNYRIETSERRQKA